MTCGCKLDFVRACWTLAKRYTKAVARWKRAGEPTRSPAEIVRIFETVCKPCPHFVPLEGKPWRGRCDACGCYLGRHAHKFLEGNKIGMETEHCPERKW